ncbi:HNH endonuclease signature motif containing protein [Methyloversatilis discipulorum]|uniref:HNH endonuclease signature motif containing protein n=1 Tax=Methyloversatilis discipulorum TaxID=1119528 RepID=UPI00037E222D|nr:HNH endonuclease signature motif containing protein [Methyloversatilis discipulorum]
MGVAVVAKRTPWTEAERELLRRLFPHYTSLAIARTMGRTVCAINGQAGKLGLQKSAEHLRANGGRWNPDNPKAVANRFQKGLVPWNKGKHVVAGGRSAETRFKPGSKPGNWMPIGSERVTKDGYLQRKLTDTGYPPRDWVSVHHIVWKEAGRDIPKGYRLVFKDGNRLNVVLENLELVSIADLMRRNTIHNLPPELREVVHLRAAIVRRINRHERAQSHEQ